MRVIFEWLTGRKKAAPRGRTRPPLGLEVLEAREVPAGVQVGYAVTQDWGSGLQAQVSLANTQSNAVTGWQLRLTYAPQISSIWDAQIVSHTGNQYVIRGNAWDADLAAGTTLSFGFIANPGHAPAVPSDVVFSGGGLGGGGGGSHQPPVANADSAFTSAGQPVTVNVLANDSDPNGSPLTVSAVGRPGHGTAVRNADSTITYTPAAGFTGTDSFGYTVGDGLGGTATASVSITVAAAAAWPAHVYAPYVDMTAWPTYDLGAASKSSGVKFFNLAFVVAAPNGQPAWGGFPSYAVGSDFSNAVVGQINAVRALGGDVAVSFGGANGQELAQAIADPAALKNAYESVINAYSLRRIDFDIEGSAVADHASIDRRWQAVASAQRDAAAAGRTLQVTVTLPVLPSGLTADGLYVLQSAQRYGVGLANVNVMAMDYGDSAAPSPQGRMGAYAIQAATSVFGQLQGLYGVQKTAAQLWGMIGVTPMIGVNDQADEVFGLADALQLAAFAKQKGLGELSLWSLLRDRQAPGGVLGYGSSEYSGVLQPPFAFSADFLTAEALGGV